MSLAKKILLVLLGHSITPMIYFTLVQSPKVDRDACSELTVVPNSINTKQVMIVESQGGIAARISLCEWDNRWKSSFMNHSISAVLGKNGLAALGKKREGDGKTPSGLYPIEWTFGTEPLALKMDFRYISSEDKFIDDPQHSLYNTWVNGATTATSYELMSIPVYRMGAVVNYNMNPIVPGEGSAIFIHLWQSAQQGTAGCIAMNEPDLLQLLHWLDKKKNPYIYIRGTT